MKVNAEQFKEVKEGKKKFEIRLAEADKNIKEGDVLVLLEKDERGNLTGKEIKKKVNFVLRTKELNYWDDKAVSRYGFVIAQFD